MDGRTFPVQSTASRRDADDSARANSVAAAVAELAARKWLVTTAVLGTAACMPLYFIAIAGRPLDPFFHISLGLTFNSMLENLLQWRFDVAPDAIRGEGFAHDGKVFAYFGVFPSLLRAVLLPFPSGLSIDVTIPSIWLASLIKVAAYAAAVVRVAVYLGVQGRIRLVAYCLLATVFLGGVQLPYLRPSIYGEVISWSGAIAAIFVLVVLTSVTSPIPGRRTPYLLLCLCVGLSVNTRIPMGVGLLLATAFLVVAEYGLAVRQQLRAKSAKDRRHSVAAWISALRQVATPSLLGGILVLAIALGVCAVVNYERWGNPFTFVDLRYHLQNQFDPGRLALQQAHGVFNIARVWFGMIYYFFPIWIIPRSPDALLFYPWQKHWVELTELPIGSFFLSDPLPTFLALAGLREAVRTGVPGAAMVRSAAVLCGLAVTCLLILSASPMTFRYRADFQPFFNLASLLGWLVLGCQAQRDAAVGSILAGRRTGTVIVALTLVGLACAPVMFLAAYKAPFGELGSNAPAEQIRSLMTVFRR